MKKKIGTVNFVGFSEYGLSEGTEYVLDIKDTYVICIS